MLAKVKKHLSSVVILMAAVIFIAWLPLPFKPSLWAYFKEKTTLHNLQTFTDPVFLPDKQYRAGSTFTAYEGWKNAYVIAYRGKIGNENLSAFMIQLTAESELKEDSEGPSAEDMANLRQLALTGKNCEMFDEQYNVRYCKSDLYGYLIRSINYQNKTFFIALQVFNGNAFLEPKTTKDFRPETDGMEHKIIKSLSPVDIKSAEKFIKIEI